MQYFFLILFLFSFSVQADTAKTIVKKADGTIYLNESFNSVKEAKEWLAKQKADPSWNANYVVVELVNSSFRDYEKSINDAKIPVKEARMTKIKAALANWEKLDADQQKELMKAMAEQVVNQ